MPSELDSPMLASAARLQGQELRRGRLASALTQRKMAENCEVRLATYQSWEYGKRIAPADIREWLVETMGLDRGLLGLDPEHTCPCCGRTY
jgi:DNA-binding transcriptional regulator YiaG